MHSDRSKADDHERRHPSRILRDQVSCGCGNKFTTRSTRKELKVDICNVCHPFYTGKLKFVDTAGRIEKFKNKFAAAGYASLKRRQEEAEPVSRCREFLAARLHLASPYRACAVPISPA